MKQLFTTAAVLFSMTAFAQVGINNTSPKATLDITAKTTGSKPEGLIVPQLTGDQIRFASTGATPVYGLAQKGVIIFASAADTAPAGATSNITAPGYYYFDGSVWQKIVTGSTLNTSLNSGNIYVGNASNVATAVTPSGDVTISNTGVTAIGTGKVTSSQIADGTVANADLANMSGLTVKGNSTNAAATPTDIAAGTDGYVLRRSGTALGFGTVATAGIADNAVTVAKLPSGATGTTFLRGDGTWVTPTDTNTTYTAGTGLSLSGTTFSATDASTSAKGIVQLAGDLAGTAASPSIASSAVTSAKIADGTVANADLASGTGGIYKGDGSLSGNTTVTQGTNTMAFTSTASAGTSHFTVDGTTLNVDAVNNRVGIGVAAPKSFLQVSTLNGGASVDAGIFSINNCWLACSQSYTARNIVLNNLNSTNSVFASIDFVPSTDPTAPSGSSIQGIDRDGTNNYAGIGFWTRNASSGYGQRMVVKSAGNVGIGTSTPQATLDVNAISSGTSPEGIIAPRLSLTALQGYTYGTNQTGAMVYVNSVSGTPAGQTANVTAVGYYYFDGTNWLKMTTGASVTDATTTAKGIVQLAGDLSGTAASPSIATSAVNSAKIADGTVANADLNSGVGGIYKGSGSLSGNTTVAQGGSTLAFTTSATNGFSVAGSTLSVDGVGNKVGIGTAAPITKLDTRQNPGSSSPGNGAIAIGETTQAAGSVGPGAIRYSTNGGGTIEYSNGTAWNTLTGTVKKSLVYGNLTDGQTASNGGGTFSVTESFDQNNDFASNVFTVPRAGNYSISLCALTVSSSWNLGDEFSINAQKNGVGQVVGYWAAPTSASYYGGTCTSVTINAVAGDLIKFGYFNGSSAKTIHVPPFNKFSIQEL